MESGWFLGDFEPTVNSNSNFEVGVKTFNKGDSEMMHYQLTATEWTCVIRGRVRIGMDVFEENDIVEIPPLEAVDFEALEDSILVVVKSPSIPLDKVIV
jgi:hypothetical protein